MDIVVIIAVAVFVVAAAVVFKKGMGKKDAPSPPPAPPITEYTPPEGSTYLPDVIAASVKKGLEYEANLEKNKKL